MTRQPIDLVRALEQFFARFVTVASPDYLFAAALWVIATYLHTDFDAFPYLCITSAVKQSGKTRFMELLAFTASNPRTFTAATPAAIFEEIKESAPTLFIDEAEPMNSESASSMRSILNSGYRRGGEVARSGGVKWPVYCPKVFVLIGDVMDTLRDRSIIFTMFRGAPPERFTYNAVKAQGHELGERVKEAAEENRVAVVDRYITHKPIDFLMDRDEEIWMPLFAVCEVFCPARLKDLRRVAVDLATEKTQEARHYGKLKGAEEDATRDAYARRLLLDLHTVMVEGRAPIMYTADVLDALKAIDIAPWRKFRGDGLNAITMGALLEPFGVAPRLIKRRGKVARGYRREDVAKAVKKL